MANEPFQSNTEQAAPLPPCWFLVELFTRRSLKILYTIWLLVLVMCMVLSIFAAAQFDCYDFCGQTYQSCSIFGVNAPASCVNLTSTEWQSTGPAIGSSPLRRFSRVVIAQPGSLSVPSILGVTLPNGNTTTMTSAKLNSTVSLVDASLDGATLYEVNANRTLGRRWTLEKQVNNGFISLLLPEGFAFASDTVTMTIKLRQTALFRNGTVTGPYTRFSDKTSSADISFIFLSLSPTYAIIEVVVRYVGVIVNLAFLIAFIVSHSGLDGTIDVATLKAFDVKAFAADYGVIAAFQLITLIFCDPLAGFTLNWPTDGFLRYWSDHFTYALYISTAMLIGMFLSVTMPFVFHADRWWYRLILSLVSAAFALAYFILDALVASRGMSTGLVFSDPQSDDPFLSGIAISGLVVVSLWCAVVALFFVTNKHRIVWNHGRRLYSGRVRLRIVSLRLVASCVAMYALYWICIYIPVQVTYSSYVPIFGRSGIQDTVAATWIACLASGLFIARRFAPQDAPLRPQRFDKVVSDQPMWQVQAWNGSHFRFLEAFAGYFFLTEKHRMQFARKHSRATPYRSFFCWETANSCLALSNEVYYDAPESSCFASIAAEPTELESCVACCCWCCTGPTSADEKQDFETHDEPDNVCESRMLNVEQHGYTLVGALNIAGVQVIVTTMMGEDRGNPYYKWRDAREPAAATDSPADDSVPGTPHLSRQTSAVSSFASAGRMTHIVVTFRGTANSANAYTDATITRTVFRAMADRTSGRAHVHAGFARCWESLQVEVFAQIDAARRTLAAEIGPRFARNVPIVFTGHSLGGALAVLGAYAYCRSHNQYVGDLVHVYTFGMPRVGNVHFVKEYNLLCPETYRVTNENDKVSEVGHCFRAHVGRTVVVDRDGNFMVEPNAIEERYQVLSGGGFAVKNHFLYRYGRAFDRVFKELRAPFKSFLALEPVANASAEADAAVEA